MTLEKEIDLLIQKGDVVEMYSFLDSFEELKPCCEGKSNAELCEFVKLRNKMNELLSIKKPFMFHLRVAFNKGVNEFKRHKALMIYNLKSNKSDS